MNLDLSGSQLGRHHRVRAQVLNLLQHIFLNGFVQVFRIQRRVTVNAMAFTNDFHGGTAMAQPFLYVRQALKGRDIQCTFDGTAVGVAADDDVSHAEHRHSIFDGSGHASGLVAVGRDHVAGITADEQVTGVGAGHHVRVDA